MKPIVFHTPMVQAILKGHKTQTRRVIIPQPKPSSPIKPAKIPYLIGDTIWVREAFRDAADCSEQRYEYRADHFCLHNSDPSPARWRPSIHMPQEAARIFLRVINLRAEPLQNISNQDILKEGWSDIGAFTLAWDQLNAKRGYSWQRNPWVWIIEFIKTE